jgi:hypothetical protein
VKPVEEDTDGGLLAAAMEARRLVPSVYESMKDLTCKDEAMPLWDGVSMDWWGIHSHVEEEPPFVTPGPFHSYREADAAPMVPGEMEEVLFKRSHRIRIAIGGADADTFARIPAGGTPLWTLDRSPSRGSHIMLPVIPR